MHYNIDVTSTEKAKLPQGKTCEYTYKGSDKSTYTDMNSTTKNYNSTVKALWVDNTNTTSKHETDADGLAAANLSKTV